MFSVIVLKYFELSPKLYSESYQKLLRTINTSHFLSQESVGLKCRFLTRKLRACARASCSYDMENGTRSLARLVDSCKLFFDFRLLSAFDSFWQVIHKQNGDLCC